MNVSTGQQTDSEPHDSGQAAALSDIHQSTLNPDGQSSRQVEGTQTTQGQIVWWTLVAALWLLTPLMWLLLGIVLASLMTKPGISNRAFNDLNSLWNNGDVVIAGVAGSLAIIAALATGRGAKRWWSALLAALSLATALSWTLLELWAESYYTGPQFVLEPVLLAVEAGALLGAWILAVGQPPRVLFALFLAIPIGLVSAFFAASGDIQTSYTTVGIVGRLLLFICVLILAALPRTAHPGSPQQDNTPAD